ncbi:MAG: tape measure protein [Nitrospira sp.]|nr:tape measure protein [Nitrospira sp.]
MTDATLSAKVTADIADFSKKMGAVKDSIDRVGSSTSGGLGQANQALGKMESHVTSIGNILSGGALAAIGKGLTDAVMEPLLGVAKSAVLMADQFTRAKMAFTTMLGSAEKATAFLKELQDTAVSTPFEFTQLQDASKRLLAMGIEAKKIPGMIVQIGDAVAGLGSGKLGFDRITTAIGQMNAKGRATAEEMRQFTEAGIGAWDALASHLNITVAEAMERVTKKQVDSATAITAIMSAMGTRFGGLMAQQSSTIEGQLSNLQDVSTMILAEIGKELIAALKLPEAIAAVGDFARSFLDWFKQLDGGTKQLILVLTGTFAASGPILVAVGAFMAAMAVVTAPMLAGGAIVAGIIAGVTLLVLNWQKLKDTGIALWTSLTGAVKSVIDRMVAGVEQAIARLGAILTGIREKTDAVKAYFKSMYDAVVGHSYIPDMVDEIGAHMKNLDVAMTAPARQATVATGRLFEGFAFTAQGAINQVVSTMNFAWGSATQGVSQALAQMTTQQVNWAQVGIQIGQQFLAAMINQIISLMTQWAIATVFAQTQNAAQLAAHSATEGAKTAVTATNEAARMGIALATNKVIMAGTIATLGSIAAVGTAASAVLAAIVVATSSTLAAIGAALVGTIVGAPLGAAFLAASGVVLAAGIPAAVASAAAIQAAVGTAIVAATTALAIPALAAGGIVTGPTLAMIGEAGPEAVVPLGRSFGQPTQQTIIVSLDGQELMRYVADKLIPYLRLKGAPI